MVGILNVFWQWGAGKTEILTILGEAVLVVLLTISFEIAARALYSSV